MSQNTIVISKDEYNRLKHDSKTLKKLKICERLLEFEKNISFGKRYYRKDSGF